MPTTTRQDAARDAGEIEVRLGRRAPYTMNGDWVLLAPVSAEAKTLYWALNAHVNQKRAKTGDTEVWPTQPQLAVILAFGKRQKIGALAAELESIDAIERRTVRVGPNRMRPRTVYTVHQEPPEDGVSWPTSLAEFYARLKDADQGHDQASPQVNPNVPVEGPSKVPVEERSNVPVEGREQDEGKPDEGEQDEAKNCRASLGDLGEPGYAGTPEVTETPGQLPNGSPTKPAGQAESLPPRAHVIPEHDREVNPDGQEFCGSSEKDTTEDQGGDEGEQTLGPVDLSAAGRSVNGSHLAGERRNGGSRQAETNGCGVSGCWGDGWRTLTDGSRVPCKSCRTQADAERDLWEMPLVDLPF